LHRPHPVRPRWLVHVARFGLIRLGLTSFGGVAFTIFLSRPSKARNPQSESRSLGVRTEHWFGTSKKHRTFQMVVFMTRTAIRHSLSVLAAVAIASASGPTSAGDGSVLRDWIKSSYWSPCASKPKTPNGLATTTDPEVRSSRSASRLSPK
jgi:hypothetical protein